MFMTYPRGNNANGGHVDLTLTHHLGNLRKIKSSINEKPATAESRSVFQCTWPSLLHFLICYYL